VISAHLDARRMAVNAIASEPLTPRRRAERLDEAAEALAASITAHDDGATARAARAYVEAVQALAALERWEQDTLSAATDADRHRRAAVLRASRAADGLEPNDALFAPLRAALQVLAAVESFDERHRAREMLLAVPLPAPLIEAPREPVGPVEDDAEPPPPIPRAAVITSLDGSPVTAANAVSPGQVHDLEIEARVLDWPADADQLVVRYISRWPATAVEVPDVIVDRPAEPVEGVWTGRGAGTFVLHAGAADPLKPVKFAVNAELVGPEGGRSIKLLGHGDFAVRTFDPTRDVITGAAALDEHILDMLAELREQDIAPHEQSAFGRFFGALTRAGVRILADREFPEGTNPTERDFQAELLKRLGMATELSGRVTEHAWQGGGPTDLAHDGVVAELKVEKTTPATLERAKDFLGQPVQYASADHRQLAILAILDMTPKAAPPGVLANTAGWLEPRLHGLDDPAYPSRVAVIIINANLPRPSDWS
jgi:hypothetical protein